MATTQEVKTMLDELLQKVLGSDAPTADALSEAVDTEYLEQIDRATYEEAMEMVLDEYEVDPEIRQPVYDHLDAEGEYTPEGLQENLRVLLENDDITNQIDNALTIEHGAEVHYADITQENDTNVANATGDGAIAGRDQWGQFQTGDGTQVGDHNEGVVNQGDNSGQQAGYEAHADDITTGDGNFNNEGQIDDSAIAFGGGAADNTANELDDHSTNDSFNTEHSYNEEGSYNTQDSYNTEETYTETATVDANLDADVDHSFNSDDDYKDVDDSHNVHEAEEVGYE